MRIFLNPLEAFREVERDLWEMGIDVHPQTMQDKYVGDDPDYLTKEVRAYGFQIVDWVWSRKEEVKVVEYMFADKKIISSILDYIALEFNDRISNTALNPGHAYIVRKKLWNEFLHEGKFAYTYSERIAPQLEKIRYELDINRESRQGIINIHSNIMPCSEPLSEEYRVIPSADLTNIGGSGRIPCSMYYQIMIREGKVDFIYTMRSCDFLAHFTVDVLLALRMQNWFCKDYKLLPGMFTYFTGSLHAYAKDMKERGIF